MDLLRITAIEAGEGFRLRSTLDDGSVIERDVSELLNGPIFEPLRSNPALFRGVRVDGGTVAWPNGADLCPDVVIWGGRPPATQQRPAAFARMLLPRGA